MEDNIVLQVLLHEDKGLEVHIGDAGDKISPLTLIGILEQVKMNVFDGMTVEKIKKPSKTYDA